MEIETLKNFLVVAREENISRAAEILHISQPTLSRQMINLGKEFNKKLFVHANRRMTLTRDGVLLRKRASEILELVKKTGEEMRENADEIAGNIYFAASESNIVRAVFSRTEAFRVEHPNVCYRMLSGSNEYIMDMVHKGIADFGLAYGEIDASRFDSIPLKETVRWGILAKADSPLCGKSGVTPQDILKLSLVMNQSMISVSPMQEWLGVPISELHIVGTFTMLINAQMMVESGLGYAVITDNLLDYRNSGLTFIPLRPALPVPMSLIWKRYQAFSTQSAAFLDILKRALGDCLNN